MDGRGLGRLDSMIEIRFRVWDRHNNIWADSKNFSLTGNGDLLGYDQYKDDPNSPQKQWTKVIIDNQYFINQSTNIKDSEGREIFEGDLVQFEDWEDTWSDNKSDHYEKGTGTVKWGHNAQGADYSHGFYLELKDYTVRGLELRVMKVVGNIYENKPK